MYSPKMSTKILVDKMLARIYQKCPQKFAPFVREKSATLESWVFQLNKKKKCIQNFRILDLKL